MLLASTASQAADGQITFNGKIAAGSCKVDGAATGGGSVDKNLNMTMPSISSSAIGTAVGSRAGMTAFTISLSDCKGQSATVAEQMRVTFAGQGDPSNAYVLKNTATTGAATGVGIQLLKADGTSVIDINGGSNKSDETTLPLSGDAGQSYILNFNAAYVNVSGSAPTAGVVTATATYAIEYN
ncbi:fimbrial protein [Vibrio sp. TRT 1302]|uniref:fimbrial protein n=1 Tax=Vibrio sp. TRT 1302 TaxID=3418504 RepID=UPI003CF13B85